MLVPASPARHAMNAATDGQYRFPPNSGSFFGHRGFVSNARIATRAVLSDTRQRRAISASETKSAGGSVTSGPGRGN